jgi:hypothetical protein
VQAARADDRLVGTSGGLLAVFAASAFGLVYLGGKCACRKARADQLALGVLDEPEPAVAAHEGRLRKAALVVRGVLAAAGFVLWSYVIPGSPTNQSDFGVANAAVLPIVVPFLALLFGLFAENAASPDSVATVARWLSRDRRDRRDRRDARDPIGRPARADTRRPAPDRHADRGATIDLDRADGARRNGSSSRPGAPLPQRAAAAPPGPVPTGRVLSSRAAHPSNGVGVPRAAPVVGIGLGIVRTEPS